MNADRRTIRVQQRERGVVIIIVLIALLLLAAMVFYVMNLGRAVNARVVTQHAADTSAQAGAGWIARSMNTVAMNNVEMSRQIALINVLDAMPLAVDLSVRDETESGYDDLEALRVSVSAQLRTGVSDAWFERLLRKMSAEVEEDDQQLKDIDRYFRENPDSIINMTHFIAPNAPDGRGHIWRAMYTLGDISQATMENMNELAVLNSIEMGEINLPRTGPTAQNAAAIGVMGQVPWQRGRFNDFRRPVIQGLLPTSVDDKVNNRGPFDTIFGWRWKNGQEPNPEHIRGPGTPPIPSGPTSRVEATYYTVYGTQRWMIDQIPRRNYPRLHQWVSRIANIKANYIFPGLNNLGTTVIDPQWEVDIETDNDRSNDPNSESTFEIAEADSSRIRETMFVVGEIKSRTPNNPGYPNTQGVTWNYIQRSGMPYPFLAVRRGWVDPRTRTPIPMRSTTPVQYEKINNHIWRVSGTYLTNPDNFTLGGDPEISLPPRQSGVDGAGNPVYEAQEVHWIMDIMLMGVNVGEEVEVRNPYAGFNPNAADAPAPYDIDHSLLKHDDPTAIRDYLTVFAAAQQNDVSLFWPSGFDRNKPYPMTVAISKARVSNNHSWDMWTQMWHAKLVPIDDSMGEPTGEYEHWTDMLDRYTGPYGNAQDIADLAEYLRAIAPMADTLLHH